MSEERHFELSWMIEKRLKLFNIDFLKKRPMGLMSRIESRRNIIY